MRVISKGKDFQRGQGIKKKGGDLFSFFLDHQDEESERGEEVRTASKGETPPHRRALSGPESVFS